MVFVVGIFDFSGAYTLKQKLTNVARDAARAAAADPANDLQSPSSSLPASVSDAYQVVFNYLVANKINTCGMTFTLDLRNRPGRDLDVYQQHQRMPGTGLTIIINRGYYFRRQRREPTGRCELLVTGAGAQTAVIGTCVSIQYAYQWQFGRVVSLLGSTLALPSNISATAVAMNEN